jgi:hypothetical protein
MFYIKPVDVFDGVFIQLIYRTQLQVIIGIEKQWSWTLQLQMAEKWKLKAKM